MSEFTPEMFRQKLAGLIDPDAMPDSAGVKQEIRDTVTRCVAILAHLYSDALDRLSIWSKIDAAVQSASVKCNGDLQRWLDLCLESVMADAGRAAACDALFTVRSQLDARPAGWGRQLLDYVLAHRFAALQFGRARWEEVKKGAVEL